jgi:hypothetical protein
LQGLESVIGQILVDIDRVKVSAVFGGNIFLSAQKIGNRFISHIYRIPVDRLLPFIG